MNKIYNLIITQFLLINICCNLQATPSESDESKHNLSGHSLFVATSTEAEIGADINLPLGHIDLNSSFQDSSTLSQGSSSFIPVESIPDVLIPDLMRDAGKDLCYREFSSIEQAESYSNSNRQEKIIGSEDRRERLDNRVQEKDWNCHVYLEVSYNNRNLDKNKGQGRTTYYGSGILIDYNLLLTAAHVLFDPKDGGYPDSIDCFVATYQYTVMAQISVSPKLTPDSVVVPPEYIKYGSKKIDADMGLIVFDAKAATMLRDKGITIAKPFLNVLELRLDVFQTIEFYVTGYPGVRIAYSMGGKIQKGDQEGTITYDIDTEPGQSGSAIWFKNKNEILCIGVHTNKGEYGQQYNIGTLFHPFIIEAIRNMKIKPDGIKS